MVAAAAVELQQVYTTHTIASMMIAGTGPQTGGYTCPILWGSVNA